MHVSAHQSLDESVGAGYVVISDGDYVISNRYWGWCCSKHIPFTRIILRSKRRRYAYVCMDAYPVLAPKVSYMLPDVRLEILDAIKACPIKPGTMITVGPLVASAYVDVGVICQLASFFTSCAVKDGTVVSDGKTGFEVPEMVVECKKRDLLDAIWKFQNVLQGDP